MERARTHSLMVLFSLDQSRPSARPTHRPTESLCLSKDETVAAVAVANELRFEKEGKDARRKAKIFMIYATLQLVLQVWDNIQPSDKLDEERRPPETMYRGQIRLCPI